MHVLRVYWALVYINLTDDTINRIVKAYFIKVLGERAGTEIIMIVYQKHNFQTYIYFIHIQSIVLLFGGGKGTVPPATLNIILLLNIDFSKLLNTQK